MQRYYSMSDFCKELYGKKLYKLSIDAGFTCPNRDGAKGTGGCSFCSEGGSGEFCGHGADIGEQIALAKKRIEKKAKNCGYIAYFQAFTNTYAPLKRLRELFFPIALRSDIDVISIATRPDCLEKDKLEMLQELNQIKPVWVELGLQTSNDETAKAFNRGFHTIEFMQAAKALREIGVEVIAHVILGLPGENQDDMLQTIDCVNASGATGIKLQLLHVLKGTRLYKDFIASKYAPFTMEEYFAVLSKCVMNLRGDIAIHRLTGDGDKRLLIAPMWSADKKTVLNRLKEYFEKNDVVQGKDYTGRIADCELRMEECADGKGETCRAN